MLWGISGIAVRRLCVQEVDGDLPRAQPMLRAARVSVENCILTNLVGKGKKILDRPPKILYIKSVLVDICAND